MNESNNYYTYIFIYILNADPNMVLNQCTCTLLNSIFYCYIPRDIVLYIAMHFRPIILVYVWELIATVYI